MEMENATKATLTNVAGQVGNALNNTGIAIAAHSSIVEAAGLPVAAAFGFMPGLISGLMPLLLAQLEDIILQQMGKGMYDENKFIELFPVKRMGKPQEIANGIVWLCSDESSYATSHIFGHRRGL